MFRDWSGKRHYLCHKGNLIYWVRFGMVEVNKLKRIVRFKLDTGLKNLLDNKTEVRAKADATFGKCSH